MSLYLDLQIQGNAANTLDGVVIKLVLQNLGKHPVNLPASQDESGAWQVKLLAPTGRVLRLMSGRTNREMTTGDAAGLPPFVAQLAPGASWTKEIDLSTYHHLLGEGAYELQGKLDWQPESVHLESPPRSIRVDALSVDFCQVIPENPFIPLATVLLGGRDADHAHFHLRAHTLTCPLAAWYAAPVVVPAGAQDLTLGQMISTGPRPFARLFHRLLVWRQDETLYAQIYEKGLEEGGGPIASPLPKGHRFLKAAGLDAKDRIVVFTLESRSVLHCSVLKNGRLEGRFVYDLPYGLSADPAIGVTRDSVQIVAAKGRNLFHVNMDFQGRLRHLRHVYRSTIPHLMTCEYAANPGSFRAVFLDAPGGKSLECVEYSWRTQKVNRWHSGQLPLRGDLREAHFARNPNGKFFATVSTSRNRLYAICEEHPPYLLARGEKRFFPHVVSPDKTYVGYYSKTNGYRFVQYRIIGERPKIISGQHG